MLTIERATQDEFLDGLSLIKCNEAQTPIPGVSWDQEWALNNYQHKDNYSIFKSGHWIGFLSLEVLPNALFVHTLQLIPDAQGRIWGFRVYEWILARAESQGIRLIKCNVLKNSSAAAMYLRLGFELVESDKFLCNMQLVLTPQQSDSR